ncbi:MAG: type II toxin-antitoxin system prevent-host-death family antitoxin [Leptospiraceae bacterium]|nr:type II toxin-antitoxin system prevent-host-death family antitoxin [Leptospiraceae bacterium]
MKDRNNFSVSEAKSKFSEVLHLAQDEPMFISSRGKDVGVILSKESYDRLLDQEKRNLPKMRIAHFLETCQDLRDHLPEQIKISKRKSRKTPSFD